MAIESYEKQHNERKRLRMSGRPLLQLIHHQVGMRKSSGGSVQFSHVKAHTDGTDMASVGNRLADFQANRVRIKSDRSYPLSLAQLPVRSCERFLSICHQPQPDSMAAESSVIIDDIRQTSLSQIMKQALIRWSTKPNQGVFESKGIFFFKIRLGLYHPQS